MSNSPGRNDPCQCGSGRKFKNCCQQMGGSASTVTSKTAMIVVAVVVVLGIVILGVSLTVGNGQVDCPPGTVWSAAHQHCH